MLILFFFIICVCIHETLAHFGILARVGLGSSQDTPPQGGWDHSRPIIHSLIRFMGQRSLEISVYAYF